MDFVPKVISFEYNVLFRIRVFHTLGYITYYLLLIILFVTVAWRTV